MKKLDKLVLKAFWGPFLVTLSVVVFIFLMRIMIFYIDEFVSKDVGLTEYARLFFYFTLSTIPIALPLAVLLSSLMAFGNLGEFFELTAIKSAGVSVIRVMRPLLVFAVCISIFSFFFNDRTVPWANLKGYSLLFDIKTTKATLKIKEGIFYNDLPGYSIKVDEKLPDGKTMKGMVIYKHDDARSYERGNTQVILADSGRMYTINNNGYLVIELFSGSDYQEVADASGPNRPVVYGSAANGGAPVGSNFVRNRFDQYKLVVSLESFGMRRTDEDQFKYHEFMKNIEALNQTTDSIKNDLSQTRERLVANSQQYFTYHARTAYTYGVKTEPGKWIDSLVNKPMADSLRKELLSTAKTSAQSMASFAKSNQEYLQSKRKEGNRYELEMHHKYTQALSCLVMFLIGAPLGAIIKKGGFGVPVLISIVFFILMYVLTIQADKWVKGDLVNVEFGAWLPNSVLLLVGLYFINHARNDSRLFDKDVYIIFFGKIKKKIQDSRRGKVEPASQAAEVDA
ncbi:LptF/LptG family permease [Telluribacter sp.]|jgi:lipopolysaccharide export system permease protein|uniref:LptF/LptG family permease n=1 Tax=Telluribacter sp. TaxID=1978767 RepID=UPI002E150DDE|nr:LptF/LptG family permease [Telluribacter sp.]